MSARNIKLLLLRYLSVPISPCLATQLRGRPCAVFGKDTTVRSGPDQAHTRQGLWSYPDLLVVCGEPQYHDQVEDVLLNPRVVIEVLSPSTQAFDRGDTWERYRTWLASLEDYVLVARSVPLSSTGISRRMAPGRASCWRAWRRCGSWPALAVRCRWWRCRARGVSAALARRLAIVGRLYLMGQRRRAKKESR